MYDKLILTHCGPVTPCGVVKFGHLFIRTSLSPIQRQAIAFRSQCRVIVISTQRHQFQWNFNGYINIFHSRKCSWYQKVGAILFRPRCILSISPYIVLGINFPARWALLLLWLPPANFWKMIFIKKWWIHMYYCKGMILCMSHCHVLYNLLEIKLLLLSRSHPELINLQQY